MPVSLAGPTQTLWGPCPSVLSVPGLCEKLFSGYWWVNHGGLEVVVSKEEHWDKSVKAYMSQHNLPSFRSL